MTHADLVFTGGPVFTADGARSRATTVAVTGERITAVGHHEVRELVGRRTEVVDLAGKLLLPGFQDAHVHAVYGGVELGECDLTGTAGLADCQAGSAPTPRHTPSGSGSPAAAGHGVAFPGGTPNRQMIDAVVPDRPVSLLNRDRHGAWANSRALELAGITAATPDPADGRIERDGRRQPTGMLQEGATGLVARLIPQTSPAERLAGLLRAQELLHSLGITGWQDAILGVFTAARPLRRLRRRRRRRHPHRPRQRRALVGPGTRRGADPGAGRAPGEAGPRPLPGRLVKIMQDGVAENHTAAMLDPYWTAAAARPRNLGLSFVDPRGSAGYVTELDALGFQVHFHALGDRAVREALDAVEAARHRQRPPRQPAPPGPPPGGPPGGRPPLRPTRRDRQPPAAVGLARAADGRADHPVPGRAAGRASVPLRRPAARPARAGGRQRLAGEHPDLLAGIHVAVNRVGPARTADKVFLPEQRLDLGTAMAAYTAGSARVNHLTTPVGPGRRARRPGRARPRPLRRSRPAIAETRVEQTFVGGERVWAAPGR